MPSFCANRDHVVHINFVAKILEIRMRRTRREFAEQTVQLGKASLLLLDFFILHDE